MKRPSIYNQGNVCVLGSRKWIEPTLTILVEARRSDGHFGVFNGEYDPLSYTHGAAPADLVGRMLAVR